MKLTLLVRRAARAVRRRPLLEVGLVILVVAWVWMPFLRCKSVDDTSLDWTFRGDYVGYQLHALFEDHAFPFWVTDGRFEQLRAKGVHDFFANPETDVLSILTPLAKMFGFVTAAKVSLVVYLSLGVVGCRRLLVLLGGRARFFPLLITSLLALCNGALVAHVMHGHVQFAPAATFPLALALILEGFEPNLARLARVERACLAGAMLAGAYYAGAVHPLFYFILCFLILLPLATLINRPRLYLSIAGTVAIVGISFVALAAFKLLPGARDFSSYRAGYSLTYDGWRDFLEGFVVPWVPVVDHQVKHESNMYLGWPGVILMAFCLGGLRDARSRALVLVCGLSVWGLLSLKPDDLTAIPIIRAQGSFTRARLLVLMVLGVVAGSQVQHIFTNIARRAPRGLLAWMPPLLAALSIVLACDLTRTNVARHVHIGSEQQPPSPHGLGAHPKPRARGPSRSAGEALFNGMCSPMHAHAIAFYRALGGHPRRSRSSRLGKSRRRAMRPFPPPSERETQEPQ